MTALAPPPPRHWRFTSEDDSSRGLTVHALTPLEANESDHDLKKQVEQLLIHVYTTATSSPAKAAGAAANLFAVASSPPDDKDQRTARKLLLFVYRSLQDATDEELSDNNSKILGFARVYEDFETNVVVVSSFALLPDVDDEAAIATALFIATQEVGEAFAQSMLQAQTLTQHVKSDAIPLWRGLFGASEFLKQLLREEGFSGERFDCLELTKFFKTSEEQLTVTPKTEATMLFPEGITVKPLDLAQDDLVKVYDVLKMAFGGNPPTFQAWKAHYVMQPRFAPELSFFAWASGDNEAQEPVSVLLIERIMDGEGGGDDEVDRVYTTHGELQKAAKLSEQTDQTLEFPSDFDARKSAIEATARAAYVCGVATKVEFRSQGIASKLLKLSFEKAEKTTLLEKVTLGTDRFNKQAVRAYLRAGMAETASENPGRIVSKDVQRSGP